MEEKIKAVLWGKEKYVLINNGQECEEFMVNVFQVFNCNVDDFFINGGDRPCEIINEDNSIEFYDKIASIEQLWVRLIDSSLENYAKFKEVLKFIKTRTNIEIVILDLNIVY